MPNVFYTNRQNTISEALSELKNYPAGHKPPSVNSVAKNYRLSEAILRRAKNNSSPPNQWSLSTILTEYEEGQLIGYCLNMQQLGFGLTKSNVNKRPHPFGDKGPGWA